MVTSYAGTKTRGSFRKVNRKFTPFTEKIETVPTRVNLPATRASDREDLLLKGATVVSVVKFIFHFNNWF